jgi:hypothetical protein
MAYCVHCGVELAASEDRCPLCKTPVMDPNPAWREPEERPYPERLEVVPPRIDRRYGAQLAALFLLIPMAAVLISNLLINRQVTWSAYVLGAIACVEVWVLLPMYLDITRPYLYIALDILSSALYLLLIDWRTGGGNWYLPLALPLTLIVGGAAMLSVYVCRRVKMPQLDRASLVVLTGAAFLTGLEALIDLKVYGRAQLEWSVYALVPLAASAAVLRVIERKPGLKEEILKRLFL